MEAAFVAIWKHKRKNKFQKQFSKKFSLAFYKQFVCRRYYSNKTKNRTNVHDVYPLQSS